MTIGKSDILPMFDHHLFPIQQTHRFHLSMIVKFFCNRNWMDVYAKKVQFSTSIGFLDEGGFLRIVAADARGDSKFFFDIHA